MALYSGASAFLKASASLRLKASHAAFSFAIMSASDGGATAFVSGVLLAFAVLVFVVDVFAQRIVGWHAMSTRPGLLDRLGHDLPLRLEGADQRLRRGEPRVTLKTDSRNTSQAVRFYEHMGTRKIRTYDDWQKAR